MRTRYILKALPLLGAILWQGCKQNDINTDDINYEVNRKMSVAAPVAKIKFAVDDLLNEFGESGDVYKDENDLIFITYEKQIDQTWESLDQLYKNVGITYNVQPKLLAPSQQSPQATYAYSYTQKIKMNSSPDATYDSLKFYSGALSLSLNFPSGANGSITVTIPQILKNGKALTYTLTPTNPTATENLAGLKAVFGHETQSSYIEFNLSGNLTRSTAGPLDVTFSINNIESDIAYGSFGQKTVTMKNNELDFNVFNAYEFQNMVQFADFRIQVTSQNPIGIPFKMEVENVWLSKDNGATDAWQLTFDQSNVYNIAAATLEKEATSIFKVNRDNSNIENVGSKFPNHLVCDIKGTSNPDSPATKNFISRNDTIKNTLRIDFPFWFKTSLYTRNDTVDFDINDIVDGEDELAEAVNKLDVFLDFSNGFPFEVGLTIDAVDANGKIITTLVPSSTLIKGAVPTEDGKSVKPVVSNVTASVNQTQIALMRAKNVKQIIIRTKSITYNKGQEFVKLFGSNRMEIKVSMNLSTEIPNN